MCGACRASLLTSLPSRCYSCHKATVQSRSCQDCRKRSGISHVWVAAEYQGIIKDLVYAMKFGRAKYATRVAAELIGLCLPILPKDIVVTHVPTAHSRVRVRGYDQAHLMAKALAGRRKWIHETALDRHGTLRQVGAGREQRLSQLKTAFSLHRGRNVKDKHVLLLDDVVTTGATVEAATKVLKSRGARIVDVAVLAQA